MACGSSVLLHRPLSTRGQMWAERRELLLSNQKLLLERWGPRIALEHALDRQRGLGRWSEAGAPEPDVDLRPGWLIVPLDGLLAGRAAELALELRSVGSGRAATRRMAPGCWTR